MTRRRRHTPDQIIRKLSEGNKFLSAGTELNGVLCYGRVKCRSRWRQYGH